MSCWDDIDSSNYVEYRATESSAWAASGFCEVCISYLLKAQWELYTSALAKTTCKAEQRRLLKAGPPVNLKDAKALPTPEDAEIHSLWYASDGQEHSAKLEGSLVGEVSCCVFLYQLPRNILSHVLIWLFTLCRREPSTGSSSPTSTRRRSPKKNPSRTALRVQRRPCRAKNGP